MNFAACWWLDDVTTVTLRSERSMPRLKGVGGPYRVFVTSFDCAEPAHVHVERDGRACKFWLVPVSLAKNYGFTAKELRGIRRLVSDHRVTILEVWREHCGE